MSGTLSRQPTEALPEPLVRRLGYSDLPSVISIERRSFPSPWSLAMFVLELSKPSGICLAATEDDQERILTAPIEPEAARDKRVVKIPGKYELDRVAHRRPEMYGPLVQPRQ